MDTSNPLKKTGTPPVRNKTSLPLRVDVTHLLISLLGVLDSTSSGCESTLHRFRAKPTWISHKPFVS